MDGDLGYWLRAASILSGQQATAQKPNLQSLLCQRLQDYYQATIAASEGENVTARDLEDLTEFELKLRTAAEALRALQGLHLNCETLPFSEAPTFGARDVKSITLLAGVLAHWGLTPYINVNLLSPGLIKVHEPAISPPNEEARLAELQERVRSVVDLVIPSATSSQPSTSHNRLLSAEQQLAKLIIPSLVPVLFPALAELSFGRDAPDGSTLFAHLLSILAPHTNLSNLLLLLQSARPPARAWLAPNASKLMSEQLQRPGGIPALLKVMISDPDQDPSAVHLEQLARLILTPPAAVPRDAYFASIIPSLLHLLKPAQSTPLPHSIVKAVAFILSQIVLRRVCTALPYLLGNLLKLSPADPAGNSSDALDPEILSARQLSDGIFVLAAWLQNCPPSHRLADDVLRPSLPLLFSFYAFLSDSDEPEQQATQATLFKLDKTLLDPLQEVLTIWAKRTESPALTTSLQEALDASVLHDSRVALPEHAYWAIDANGQPCLKVKSSVEADEPFEGDFAPAISINPELIIKLIGSAGSRDTKAALMLRWIGQIEMLSEAGAQPAHPPMLLALKMQLLLQALEKWGPETLEKPEEALSFIAFTLRPQTLGEASSAKEEESDVKAGISLEGLKLDHEDLADAEDLTLGTQLPVLGLTLLLAVLEAEPKLAKENKHALARIEARIEPFTTDTDSHLAPLAREAREVLQLRATAERVNQSTSGAGSEYESSRAQFQEAVALLQDPILPIKAQGVAFLRKLISNDPSSTDPKLWSEIADILIRATDSDDSFLYLAAVQGLADLCLLKPADQGVSVISTLARLYVEKPNTILLPRDLDRRLRFGEALAVLVQSSGSALALFIDALVPPLVALVRSQRHPTILRASALTILGHCVETSAVSLLAYISDILEACLTLLSVESQPAAAKADEADSADDEEMPEPVSIDQVLLEEVERLRSDEVRQKRRPEETRNPITQNPQDHPSLRRAALLFVAMTTRARAAAELPEDAVNMSLLERARAVVGYVQQIDRDALVRHQAEETLEDLGGPDTSHHIPSGSRTFLP